MQKIIFFHLLNDRSGSPKVLSQVIASCKERLIPTELFTSTDTDGFLNCSADIIRGVIYRRSESKLLTLFWFLFSQVSLFILCFRYFGKDVKFYVNTMLPFGPALAGKFLGIPVYYHLHETSINPKLLKWFLKKVIRMTASKIIYVSNFLKEAEPFSGIKQCVIGNALDSAFMSKAANYEKSPKCSVQLVSLMVCSLKEYKGVVEFLKLAYLSLTDYRLNFVLVLNASLGEIESFISIHGPVPKNTIIFDRQTDVTKFYQNSDVILNLSRPDECIETFGLTIIEAMAYGLPAIVPPVGGPKELVDFGINGFHVSCYEIVQIRSLLTMLADDPDKYIKLSSNARLSANNFSIDVFSNKLLNFIVG
jgi:L-malate glycosyltransferase